MTISIQPVIVAENNPVAFHISGLTPGQDYQLKLLVVAESGTRYESMASASDSGQVAWQLEAGWSGEALIDLIPSAGDRAAATLHVFAIPAELARRIPLRVDFHIHTRYSDGHSTPAEMVIRGRELGLDALAITDHNRFDPSLEGIKAAHDLGLGLMCFTGEEITAYDWHLLSINATADVQPEDTGETGLVNALARVHALGGKAYLAHPYWIGSRQRNMPSADYDRLLAEGGLDGIELLGDVAWEENLLSITRYHDLPLEERPPILGNSDTHWAKHTFGGYWTLVFAQTQDQAGVLDAIADHHAVACARLLAGPAARQPQDEILAFGPFKQVELALFLERYVFPEHDRLCRLEAGLAWRRLAGEDLPPAAVRQAAEEVKTCMRRCFGD